MSAQGGRPIVREMRGRPIGRATLFVAISLTATGAGAGAVETGAGTVPFPAGPVLGHPRVFPAEIGFWDARHGLAILAPERYRGEHHPTVIGRTDDGGRSWRVVWRGPQSGPLVVAPGTRSAWLAGAVLRRTKDGGRTWSVVSHERIFALSFADPRYGVALAAKLLPQPAAFGPERLLVTSNGGETWKRRPLPCSGRPASLIDQVASLSAKRAWVLCNLSEPKPWNRLRFYRTRDGGRHWQLLTHHRFWAAGGFGLSFRSPRRGYYYGRIVPFRTLDGGAHWQVMPGFGLEDRETASFSFWRPQRGLMLIRNIETRPREKTTLELATTIDGGLSWQTVRSWSVRVWPLP